MAKTRFEPIADADEKPAPRPDIPAAIGAELVRAAEALAKADADLDAAEKRLARRRRKQPMR